MARQWCLSSVTLVHPTQTVKLFGNIFTRFCTLGIWGGPCKLSRRSAQGNPSAGGVKYKRGRRNRPICFVANLVTLLLRVYQSTITNRKHAKRIKWDNFLWPLANRNPDFKIHRIFKSYALAFGLLPEVTLRHSVNNRPVKRLPLVARLPPAFYIGPHAGWNYGIVTLFL